MMRQYELVERVQRYDPNADEALLNRAYVYAMRAHGNQKRADGAPYFSHPLAVAAILTDLKLDDATIVTALLHDVIEDTGSTRAEIERLFGAEIGELVDGLTKLRRLDLVTKKAEQAENFRKLLVAMSKDIRVLMVKLADRLHNMRTLQHVNEERQRRISEETIDIYAPLASRMGMQTIRDELQALAFQYVQPAAFKAVTERLEVLRSENQHLAEDIRGVLQSKLQDAGIQADVSCREKRPYSIWRKMENRQIGLEQLSDLYGFRVIVDEIHTCYRVLGLAHTTWQAVPGLFKDYISAPKTNNYQSLHTAIRGPRKQLMELQIRTHEMHRTAEYGIAAHALYKDIANAIAPINSGKSRPTAANTAVAVNGVSKPAAVNAAEDSGPYAWLRHLVENVLEGADSEDFLETTKLELFQEQVFCFSPKGRLIALPRNATPLDFAYAVHTDIGNAATGAIINGRQQPINTRLRNGDGVEIITREGHVPPIAWEGFAVTGRARSAVRRAARNAVRGQYAEIGRRFMLAAAARSGLVFKESRLGRALPRLGVSQTTVEDVLASVGRGELGPADVMKALYPNAELAAEPADHRPKNRHQVDANQEGWFNLERGRGLRFRLTDTLLDQWQNLASAQSANAGNSAQSANADNSAQSATADNSAQSANADKAVSGDPSAPANGAMPILFAEGSAVPGDRIVGVMTPGEGIRIFQIHSPKLPDLEDQPWIDVAWDIAPDKPQRFPATLKIIALNVPGSLAGIAGAISDEDGNIDEVKMVHRGSDFTDLLIVVEVWDVSHLNHILTALEAKPVVSRAERMFD